MKSLVIIICSLSIAYRASGQIDSIVIPEPEMLDLNTLIIEAITNNPELQAAQHEWDMIEAKVPQAGSLDDPTLEYMQDEFPGLQFSEAMSNRIKFMQMFPFPGKLSTKEAIAEIQAEHAHHDHLEKVNDIITRLKVMYFELWYVQQSVYLVQENIRLMKQFSEIALGKYSVGKANQQDVLKAEVEIAKMNNEITEFRSKELGIKAMMMSILNRSNADTLGYAVISEELVFPYQLDSLEQLALQNRQMLKHDSLSITENETMLSLSKREYLPDFTVGIEHIYSPPVTSGHTVTPSFNGWSVSLGVTIPFAPWVLGKASSRVEEAGLGVKKAAAEYTASKNMVIAGVRDLHAKIDGLKQQIESYANAIIPTAQQSLNVSLSLYQNSQTDFLMLIDAFRSLSDLRMEYFMLRMQFDQAIALLEQTAGLKNYYEEQN